MSYLGSTTLNNNDAYVECYIKELIPDIKEADMLYLKSVSELPSVDHQHLEKLVVKYCQINNTVTFSQGKRRVLRALGYPSAERASVVFKHLGDGVYPNLYMSFINSDMLTENHWFYNAAIKRGVISSHYYRLVFDPVIQGTRSVHWFDPDSSFAAILPIIIQLSKHHTVDLQHARNFAGVIDMSLHCGIRVALCIVAMALGYSGWSELLNINAKNLSKAGGYINNKRLPLIVPPPPLKK